MPKTYTISEEEAKEIKEYRRKVKNIVNQLEKQKVQQLKCSVTSLSS